VRYAWIASQEGTFAIKAMCRVLKGWRNGYYAWTQRTPGGRDDQAERQDETLRQRFEAHQGRYGSPRLTAERRAEGGRVGRPRVAKRMQALGLKARAAKKDKAMTPSKHNLRRPMCLSPSRPSTTDNAGIQRSTSCHLVTLMLEWPVNEDRCPSKGCKIKTWDKSGVAESRCFPHSPML